MSQITTAYQNLVVRLQVLFPRNDEYSFIPNPYDIGSNPDIILKKGIGCAIGEGFNTNRELSCNMHVDRTFNVLFSRECPVADNDPTYLPDVALDLYEDLKTCVADFEKDNTLNTGNILFHYIGDDGVRAVRNDNFSILYLSARFRATLIDNLN